MSSLANGIYDLGRFDRFGTLDTPVHRIDPRAKVVATLVFLVCVASFGKYEVLSMLPFAFFPLVLATGGGVPLRFLAGRLLIAAPFALVVGVFNPLIDRTLVSVAGLEIAAGWISYASILLRFVLTTAAALALIATTSFHSMCSALERIGLPDVLATQLLLLYRYIFVLTEEVLRTARARELRSFGSRGMGWRVYSLMLGHLLLRTTDRAGRIYQSMLARGFDGHVRARVAHEWNGRDTLFLVGWSAAFICFRAFNVPLELGQLLTGLIS